MMSKSKIISLSVFILAAAAVIFFAWGTVKNRYFSGGGSEEATAPTAQQQNANNTAENGTGEPAAGENQDGSGQNAAQENADAQKAAAEGSHLYVTSKDCDNDCEKWKNDGEDLKYCQEICGIIPASPKESKEECASLEGLEKDYCLRDAAVSKTNIDICEEIKDTRVKKACRNRVVEDLLN